MEKAFDEDLRHDEYDSGNVYLQPYCAEVLNDYLLLSIILVIA